MSVKRSLALNALVVGLLALTACGDDAGSTTTPTTTDPRLIGPPASIDPPFVLDDLTDEYGCGYGFQAGNADQSAGLFVMTDGTFGEPPRSGRVTFGPEASPWSGELRFGSDLFANWCDDVIEPDEPTPVVTETWAVTSGRGELTLNDDGTATVSLTGLVAVDGEGAQHELGDITIDNVGWGQFAG